VRLVRRFVGEVEEEDELGRVALLLPRGVIPVPGTGDLRSDVAVAVHGQRDLAMARDLHHRAGGDVLGEQKTSGCVPQVMEPDRRKAGAGEQLLDLPEVIARGNRSADGRGAHTRAVSP
jgi:hypothetical protein